MVLQGAWFSGKICLFVSQRTGWKGYTFRDQNTVTPLITLLDCTLVSLSLFFFLFLFPLLWMSSSKLTRIALHRTEDKPYGYHPGLYACITTSLLSIVLVGILTVAFRIENGKADRGEKELEASDVCC